MLHRHTLRLLCASLVALAGPSCGDDTTVVTELTLSITSDAPSGGGRIDALRILLVSGDQRWPADVASADANFQLSSQLDPAQAAVLLGLSFGGKSFSGSEVSALVTGLSKGRVVAAFEGPVDLSDKSVVKIHLDRVGQDCDEDGDGFLDCAVAGCCDVASSAFADCEPAAADANPWGVEEACEPCSDTIDQDCDGSDVACTDTDQDGDPDCEDCAPSDPTVGHGLPELCDDIDNNCNQQSDEGLRWEGLDKGQACGTGACEGGVIECDGAGGMRCSTAGLAAPAETCEDGIDNDCNGQTDEGCVVAPEGDLDGDGYTVEQGDCNDMDSSAFPGNTKPEPCCPPALAADPEAQLKACDKDCSGAVTSCLASDADFDGVPAASDCDDTDPLTYPGAPEKCGDGKDQDCFGGDQPCDAPFGDKDGDGWAAPVDCNDDPDDPAAPSIRPDAVETCNGVDDDCDGYIDDGNPVTEALCGTDIGECEKGPTVCVNAGDKSGVEECTSKGPVDELCDGLDNDCDAKTDEEFLFQGSAIGGTCDGLGVCGTGKVECAQNKLSATCSTMPDGSAPEDSAEKCDGLDNDCDGIKDEGLTGLSDSTCSTKGACGAAGAVVAASCDEGGTGTWSCDYSGVPGYTAGAELACDGVDNDCDGFIDEDFKVGTGCDGADPDACENGTWVCAADGVSATCQETGVAQESCDGKDNDCDGDTDEDFTQLGQPCDGDDTDQCKNGVFQCAPDGKGVACLAESTQNILETCDGQDNDCDGTTDEDFPTLGTPCDGVDSDLCKNGTFTCKADGTSVQCVNESPSGVTETCDGKDNDCDGETDELALANGLGGPCDGPLDADLCKEGTLVCRADGSNTQFDCDEPAEDDVELCDGADNDCDGAVDEGLGVGVVCDGPDSDSCQNGETSCVPGDPQAPPQCIETLVDIAEVCDPGSVFDEDCDGQKNEDWPELGEPCDGSDGDLCATGTWTCAPGGVAVQCTNETQTDIVETCNNFDDDCDGTTDEGLTSIVTAGCLTVGACGEAGMTTALCTAGKWACTYASPSYQATNEVGRCDSLDNDCDASTDEDFGPAGTVKYVEPDGATQRTLGQPCGLGECLGGTTICDPADPAKLTCTSAGDASAMDLCDDLDNDCDGQTDEAYGPGGLVTYVNWNGTQLGKGQTCGTGLCANGKVQCAPDQATLQCSTSSQALAAELCNAIDDDCDGTTDEDFQAGGAKLYVDFDGQQKALGQPCGTGACAGGTVVCTVDDQALTCSTAGNAGQETCDGLDNDCNGITDDPFIEGGTVVLAGAKYSLDNGKSKGELCGTGACGGGMVVCNGPAALRCSSETASVAEACDAVDNDCDGQNNEGFTYTNTQTGDTVIPVGGVCKGIGACQAGVVECASGATTRCSTLPGGSAFTGPVLDNICNGVDDDCNGLTDEFFQIGQACEGIGECGAGVFECLGTGNKRCSTNPGGTQDQSVSETCNHKDDNCDGGTDEGFPGLDVGCNTVAACAPGVTECNASGAIVCSTSPNGSAYAGGAFPNDATCNDVDSDCDGVVDEDVLYSDLLPGQQGLSKGAPCVGQGACGGQNGTVVCNIQTGSPVCSPNLAGTSETCNGIDDDCDGTSDEDFEALSLPVGAPCSGLGECAAQVGVIECVTGTTAGCSVHVGGSAYTPAGAENCNNNKDDDCDGLTDAADTANCP